MIKTIGTMILFVRKYIMPASAPNSKKRFEGKDTQLSLNCRILINKTAANTGRQIATNACQEFVDLNFWGIKYNAKKYIEDPTKDLNTNPIVVSKEQMQNNTNPIINKYTKSLFFILISMAF